jgi:hypothetical protein
MPSTTGAREKWKLSFSNTKAILVLWEHFLFRRTFPTKKKVLLSGRKAQKNHRKAKMIVGVECGQRRRLELEESKSQPLISPISTPKGPGTSRIYNDQTSFPSFRFTWLWCSFCIIAVYSPRSEGGT